MHQPLFNRIAILGLGLIGSSLARSFAGQAIAGHIAAFDKSYSALTYGIENAFIHSHYPYAGDAVENADLVILATPPSRLKKLAQEIAPFIKGGAIVMDVASVKRGAIADISPFIPAYASYVPCHPIAGSEKKGAESGRAGLFEGKLVVLTPEEKELVSEPVKKTHALWQAIGARVTYMPPGMHDRMYAYVSHLPQLLAFAARGFVPEGIYAGLERLSRSDVRLWTDIYAQNADYVLEALDEYLGFLAQINGELSEGAETAPQTLAGYPPARLFSHIMATCLIATSLRIEAETGGSIAPYAGTGFAEMSAPAKDEKPDAIFAALSQSHAQIAPLLDAFYQKLARIRAALLSGKSAALGAALA